MYTKIYKVIKLYILIKTFDGLILIMIKKINKLVFYIFVLRKYKIPKERIDQIVNDEISCLTDEETMTKRFVNSLKYLFNNINQVFNEEILNHLYFLLTNMLLDKEISSKIIQLYYGNIDNSTYYLTAIIHLYITNNIKISAIEYAFIVSELIMLKKNKSLIIPNGLGATLQDIVLSNIVSFGVDLGVKGLFDAKQFKKLTSNANANKKLVKSLGGSYSFKKNGKTAKAFKEAIKETEWFAKKYT